jgi:hypothetical protein
MQSNLSYSDRKPGNSVTVIRNLSFCLLLFMGHSIFAADSNSAKHSRKWVMEEELNQKAIHGLYNNGDFEPVIEVLERFQQNHSTYSFSDSVFIAKHLAVVYTASPATREKGRYYMMRLLELVPSAKLVDMFVSDEIDRIFEKVREEFISRQHGFGLDSLTVQLPDRPKDEPGLNHRHSDTSGFVAKKHATTNPSGPTTSFWARPTTWVVGGLAVAAVGTATYFYLANNQSAGEPREVVVPKPGGN